MNKLKLTSIKVCVNCKDKTQHDLFNIYVNGIKIKMRRCCLCGFETPINKGIVKQINKNKNERRFKNDN